VSWIALELAILSLQRVIYLERPGCRVTLRCSRTRRSGMLRRFPVFSDATQWLGQAFTWVREGARMACIVTGSGSRRRRHGMPCRWAVFVNPMHQVSAPLSRHRGLCRARGSRVILRPTYEKTNAVQTIPLSFAYDRMSRSNFTPALKESGCIVSQGSKPTSVGYCETVGYGGSAGACSQSCSLNRQGSPVQPFAAGQSRQGSLPRS
jgi:hypothetical protein